MQVSYSGVELPKDGKPIEYSNGTYQVPDNPIIPYIEGDGTGRDIWRASQRVFDAAVAKAYGGKRAVKWFEIFAGEKAFARFQNWLPDDTVQAARDLRVSIKGPLTTPVGGGIRSLECDVAADVGSIFLHPPCALLPGCSQSGETSGKTRHRDLPREHGRCLCGHRV